MATLLEIRTYRLHPGTRADFHVVFLERCAPLLERFGIRVVRYGPSEEDEDGAQDYVLIRSFPTAADRAEQEDRFYGSPEWRDGPRAAVLSRIESYHTVVLSVPDDAVDRLARTG